MFRGIQIVALFLVLSMTGRATVVYVDLSPDQIFTGVSNPNSMEFDLNNDNTVDFAFTADQSTNGFRCSPSTGNFALRTVAPEFNSGASTALSLGTIIGDTAPDGSFWAGSSSFLVSCQTTPQGLVCGGLFPGITAYLGIQFEAADGTHYGWMRITGYDNGANGGIFLDYAYESEPDTLISAGAIPEPSTILLIGLAGIGAIAHRKREL